MTNQRAQYSVGQIIEHRLFRYRGVVVDVDPEFQGSDAWYQQVARSRPPKDQPWYRVLVHDAEDETYVAERNLRADASGEPVNHPRVGEFFSGFTDGSYRSRQRAN